MRAYLVILIDVVAAWNKTMKSSVMVLALILLSVALFSSLVTADGKLSLEYFYARIDNCPTCYDPAIDNIINDIESKYSSQVGVERIDVRTSVGGERFRNYSIAGVPAVVINKEYKVSRQNITFENLDSIIAQYLGGTVNPPPDNSGSVGITLPIVVVSAFVDGINPCAFALLVFFLSYLFSIQRSRGSIIAMGAIYVVGLFVTYFLIGLGILRSVSVFGIEHFFGFVGVFLMLFLGFLTVLDYFAPGRVSLKFPSRAVPAFKSTVHRATAPAALLLGVLVGLCEFPCTGAIYGGVLAYLASETAFITGVGYLLLYNLIFVLPLVAILLFASSSQRLVKIDAWRLERRRYVKLVSGIFMIVTGLLILYWLLL